MDQILEVMLALTIGVAALLVIFFAFPGLRYEARRERRLAALNRSGALSTVAKERVRVWSALSELYLDTEVGDLVPGIAGKLAGSPWSERELWEILADEVGPAVSLNMFSIAGEWAGFDETWLTREILLRRGGLLRRTPGVREVLRFLNTFMILKDWRAVRRRVHELRAEKKDAPDAPPSGGR